MASEQFDKDAFLRSAALFKSRLQNEQDIISRVDTVMSLLGDAAIQLVALSHDVAGDGGPLLTARIASSIVHITGSDRNVIFGPAQGIGNDACLPGARLESCGQILVFGHLTGHSQTSLLTAIRVYANGDVTDGSLEWSADDGLNGALACLSQLLRKALLDHQPCWPPLADMPEHLQQISLAEDSQPEDALKKPCFGFGCLLQEHSGERSQGHDV